jgi:hypothetical protein
MPCAKLNLYRGQKLNINKTKKTSISNITHWGLHNIIELLNQQLTIYTDRHKHCFLQEKGREVGRGLIPVVYLQAPNWREPATQSQDIAIETYKSERENLKEAPIQQLICIEPLTDYVSKRSLSKHCKVSTKVTDTGLSYLLAYQPSLYTEIYMT